MLIVILLFNFRADDDIYTLDYLLSKDRGKIPAPTLLITDVKINGDGGDSESGSAEHEDDEDELTNGHLQIGPADDDDDLASVMSED